VSNELAKIQEQMYFRYEFNAYSSRNSKSACAFIYERLGLPYIFIDEFQDTSEMQWQNLIPLIDNALWVRMIMEKRNFDDWAILNNLSRWRGGKAEQFIELSKDNNRLAIR
jgi:hypothetical protein